MEPCGFGERLPLKKVLFKERELVVPDLTIFKWLCCRDLRLAFFRKPLGNWATWTSGDEYSVIGMSLSFWENVTKFSTFEFLMGIFLGSEDGFCRRICITLFRCCRSS
jgi:hypothetical protein